MIYLNLHHSELSFVTTVDYMSQGAGRSKNKDDNICAMFSRNLTSKVFLEGMT